VCSSVTPAAERGSAESVGRKAQPALIVVTGSAYPTALPSMIRRRRARVHLTPSLRCIGGVHLKGATLGDDRPLHPLEELGDDGACGDGPGDAERRGDVDRPPGHRSGRGGGGHRRQSRHLGEGQSSYVHGVAKLSAEDDATAHNPLNPSARWDVGLKTTRELCHVRSHSEPDNLPGRMWP
jgi:hypothetical protein